MAELGALYTKRQYIGDTSCEELLNRVKTKNSNQENIKADLDKLLDEKGEIKPQLKQNRIKRTFRKAVLRFILIFRWYRKPHNEAIKKLCQIKTTILSERLAKAQAKQEKETRLNEAKKAQETAQKALQEMKAAREAKKTELTDKLAAVELTLTQQLKDEAEANQALSEAEQHIKSLNEKASTLSSNQTSLTKREPLLKEFILQLDKGKQALIWSPNMRANLKQQYNSIQQESYPECDFGLLFNNSDAEKLIRIVNAERLSIPAQLNKLQQEELSVRSLIPNADRLRATRQNELKVLQEQIQASKQEQQELKDELKPFETPQEAELAAEKAAAEAAASAQAAVAAQVDPEVEASKAKKQEILNAIKSGVGGAEGEKFAQLFDVLITDNNVRSFAYDPKQKKYTVAFKEIQRMWVASEKYKAGIVMTVGRSDLCFRLSPRTIELDSAKGIDSHGDFPVVSDATIVKLELNGQNITSKGQASLGSGSDTLNFNGMLQAWRNGKMLPNNVPFEKFWKNSYPWKQQTVAGTA